MAKFSISAIMARKNKLRIFTIIVCLVLAGFLGQMMISRNPFNAKAASSCDGNMCIIYEAGYISQTGGISKFYAGSFSGAKTERFVVSNQTSLTITNGVTVELYTPLFLSSLTIKNGSNLTHSPIAVADIDGTKARTADDYLLASGKLKKVDINIAGSLKLENGGNIDVSAKGFPGGNANNAGYGPGAGSYGYMNENSDGAAGGGGGSNGGNDGKGKGGAGCSSFFNSGTDACTAIMADSLTFDIDPDNPSDYGSGGGYAYEHENDRRDTGKSGGGLIFIVADKIFLDNNSYIAANGQTAGTSVFRASGGPGSGGSIQITAGNLYTRKLISTGPDILAGIVADNKGVANGQPGAVVANIDVTNIKNNISANGGPGYRHSGGGGGGRIKIALTSTKQICRIVAGDVDYIPAECNVGNPEYDESNADVVIDNTTVNADVLKVWQPVATGAQPAAKPVGAFCLTSNDQLCDSKRHFKNLKITNNAKLTHTALTVAEAAGNDVADDTTGTGRWKKVYIETDEDIVLDSGGAIDVSGMGYPGGIGASAQNGFGPGAGLYDEGRRGTKAGGGGFGNYGGGDQINEPGIPYPTVYSPNSLISNQFNFGSGGGGVRGNRGDINCDGYGSYGYANGGAGGGRIYLKASGFIRILSTASYVAANGADGGSAKAVTHYSSWGFGCGTDEEWSYAGGGSGGHIRLEASQFEFFTTLGFAPQYNGAAYGAENNVGYYKSLYMDGVPVALKANGGVGGSTLGGGGSGGRIVIRRVVPIPPTAVKELVAENRDGAVPVNNFNPYSLQLGDIIRVKLTVSSPQTVDITDDILATVSSGSQIKCDPITGDAARPATIDGSLASISQIGNSLSWPAISPGEVVISYFCQVKRN